MSYDDFSYVRDNTNSLKSSFGRGSASASSSVDFGPHFHRQLSSRRSDIESYKYDPMNEKHRMSVSSLSGASSHAFHPSSVGTSTLDSSEIPIIPVETYVADPASVVHRENQTKNNTITEIEGVPAQFPKVEDVGEDTSALMTCIHEKVKDMAKDTSASTTLTSEEEPEELGNNNSALTTCSVKEGTSIDPCVETTYVTEAQLDAISEGEVDQTCSSSSNASQSSVSQRSERSIEEFQDPSVSTALGNDIAVPATDCNNSNHSSSIIAWKTCGWHNCVGWMENAELILNIYGEAACDGSYIEMKESVMVWHYKNAGEFGQEQAKDILEHLEKCLLTKVASVGFSTSLEKRKPRAWSRGTFLHYQWCLSLGNAVDENKELNFDRITTYNTKDSTGRAEQGTGSKNTTVTGVEMSKKSLDNGEAGDNVGLPLRGISRTGIQIGQDEGGRHTTFISNYRPRFCFRTANVTRKVDLLENVKMVMRRDNVTGTFELTTPVVLEPGLFNLCIVVFVAVNSRLIIEKPMKYGLLINSNFWFSSRSLRDWPLLMCCLTLLLFPFAAYLVEKLAWKKRLSDFVVITLHLIITSAAILYPVFMILSFDSVVLSGVSLMLMACINWLKLVSFVHTNYDMRSLVNSTNKVIKRWCYNINLKATLTACNFDYNCYILRRK
ncbi:type 1 diaclyglycerol acyltransferase [Tanacetum coccineum]